jgi:hypothetical protein
MLQDSYEVIEPQNVCECSVCMKKSLLSLSTRTERAELSLKQKVFKSVIYSLHQRIKNLR